ncbi:hypothetical protein KKF05_03985 [Patescibacteria group bacterium]|nr:hypothetical protein [Patescibacteria group bacterium]
MTKEEIDTLATVAAQIYANLSAFKKLADQPQANLQEAATIAVAATELIHQNIKVPDRRFRSGSGDISVVGMWRSVALHVRDLARFVTAYRAQTENVPELARVAKHHLIALGLILDSMLTCDNVRRALQGDLSRRVTALDPPVDQPQPKPSDQSQSPSQSKPKISVKVSLSLDRLPSDIQSIMANLQALGEEVKDPPFSRIVVAELIGYILNLVARHVQLSPCHTGPDTTTSRKWIEMSAQECLTRMSALYAAVLRQPTDETAFQQFRLQIVRELVHVFVALRNIYLAPDVQQELKQEDAKTKSV